MTISTLIAEIELYFFCAIHACFEWLALVVERTSFVSHVCNFVYHFEYFNQPASSEVGEVPQWQQL